MSYKTCDLCKYWSERTCECSLWHTSKRASDSCPSINLIPCCASCKHWSKNSDYMDQGNCDAHGGRLSPATSICNTGDYEQKSYSTSNKVRKTRTTCNKWVAFFLCLFFGLLGAHKFYEGKFGMGILYILTAGIFGIGILVDLFIILSKPKTYKMN